MRKLIGGSIALAALISGPAMAADLRLKTPVSPPVAVYNWTGFYAGLHAGTAWGSHDFSGHADGAWLGFPPFQLAFFAANESPKLKSSGFAGGAQFGFNYQTGSIVWGLEGDISWLTLKASQRIGAQDPNGGTLTIFDTSAKSSWLATVRPRVGFAANAALLYVTAGLAVAHVESSLGVHRPASGYTTFGSVSTHGPTRTGWTAGGGFEYMFAPNWSLKAEYLYVDLGSVSYTTIEQTQFTNYFESVSMKTTLNIVWAGLNYKFNWVPIVAKY